MSDSPVVEVKVELDPTIMNVLHHLPQDPCKNPRGRAGAEGQSQELVNLRRGHHEQEKMLALCIDRHMEICGRWTLTSNQETLP